jgi:hypothetical protein
VKYKEYKITVHSGASLSYIRDSIRKANDLEFKGFDVLWLHDKCKFDFVYDEMYYEGDDPLLRVTIPYDDQCFNENEVGSKTK